MIQVMPGTKVSLACRPVSTRYGFDGLAAQVKQVLAADPFSGHLFLFRSKRADYLKILYYDGTGLCLFAKRLESGKFVGRRSCASARGDRLAAHGRCGLAAHTGCGLTAGTTHFCGFPL